MSSIQPVKPKRSSKPKKAGMYKSIFLVLVAATAGYFGGIAGSSNTSLSGSGDIKSNDVRQQIVSSEGELISEITKEVGESVVSVRVTAQSVTQGFFGPQQQQSQGAGTGFIISEDGIVVTNRHVIPEGTTDVSVTLSDGTTLDDVEVIGRTNESDPLDIAFLKNF